MLFFSLAALVVYAARAVLHVALVIKQNNKEQGSKEKQKATKA